MPTTPKHGLPYPILDDAANGPAAFQALAEAVEVAIEPANNGGVVPVSNGAQPFLQVGEATLTTTQFGDIQLTLPQTFPNALLGAVLTEALSIGAGAGTAYTTKWRPDSSTTSKIGVRVYVASTGALVNTSPVRVSFVAWGY